MQACKKFCEQKASWERATTDVFEPKTMVSVKFIVRLRLCVTGAPRGEQQRLVSKVRVLLVPCCGCLIYGANLSFFVFISI